MNRENIAEQKAALGVNVIKIDPPGIPLSMAAVSLAKRNISINSMPEEMLFHIFLAYGATLKHYPGQADAISLIRKVFKGLALVNKKFFRLVRSEEFISKLIKNRIWHIKTRGELNMVYSLYKHSLLPSQIRFRLEGKRTLYGFSRTPDLMGRIIHLDLMNEGILSQEAAVISEILLKVVSLSHLYLGWNNLGDEGVIALSRAFRELNEITNLHLTWSNVGISGMNALLEVLPQMKHLKQLDLAKNFIDQRQISRLRDAKSRMSDSAFNIIL